MSRQSATLKGMFVGRKDGILERFAAEVRPVVEITEWQTDPSRGYGAIRSAPPPVVFVDLADDPFTRLNLASRIVKAAPSTLVFTVCSTKSPDLILEAFRVGVADFLVWPGDEGQAGTAVRRAVEKLGARRSKGEVYSIFSMKGGQGVTTVALNLVDHIRQLTGEKVLLFDLNLYAGQAGTFLDTGAAYTPFDLQRDLKRLDQDLLFSSLLKHERGFYLLPCPEEISDADRIARDDVARMLEVLTTFMHYIVLDLPHDFSGKTLAALEASDAVLLVFQQDLAAVKLTMRVLQFFDESGYGKDKVRLVLNRYNQKAYLDVEDLSKVLHQPVFGTLDNDYDGVMESLTKGKTVDMVVENSPFNVQVRALAGRLTGVPVVEPLKPFWRRTIERCLPGSNGKR